MLRRARGAAAVVAVVALVGGAQAATGPGSGGPRHVVSRGETLSELAARAGVSTTQLAQANRIPDPDRIRAGQR
ncbi:MAG: LysM peptidoglycan-binding domain-containing protein, partial [Actinomycetota bacterium]|nr:LysM peptidoglycan-binding domain-containing protein [Actinomycetota bacterium]